MIASTLAPAKTHGMKFWAVFNLFAAVVWGLIGVVAVGLSLLSVHVDLIPLLLVCAGGMLGLTGILLFIPTPDGRPSRAAVVTLTLAVVFGVVLFPAFLVFNLQPHVLADLPPFNPGYLVIGLVLVIALLVLVEGVYLWRKKLSSSGN